MGIDNIRKIEQDTINFDKFGPYDYGNDYCEYMIDSIGTLFQYNSFIYLGFFGFGLIS